MGDITGDLSFLSTKSFHPSNKANLEKVFIAEENEKERVRKEELRAHTVLEERKDVFKRAGVDASKLSRSEQKRLKDIQSISFMYRKPPGMQREEEKKDNEHTENSEVIVAETAKDRQAQHEKQKKMPMNEKFPELKNAPKTGAYAKKMDVRVSMLGFRHRNVKCTRCKIWGHKSTERECPKRDENPLDIERQQREDPLSVFADPSTLSPPPPRPNDDGIQLKERRKRGASPIRGGCESDASNQKLLEDIDDVSAASPPQEDAVTERVRNMTDEQRRRLLKSLKKQEKQEKREKKRRRKKRHEKRLLKKSKKHS